METDRFYIATGKPFLYSAQTERKRIGTMQITAKHKSLILLNIWLCMGIIGCSQISLQRDPSALVHSGSKNTERSIIDQSILENNKNFSKLDSKSNIEDEAPLFIPTEINNRVASWIHYFTVQRRALTIRYFERASALKPNIEKILEENDLPKELIYLVMIESGFVLKARSKAKAVGLWQMIPGTARNYGLTVNRSVDERINWIKSTEAAITYLKDLKNVFGSWYLAFSAYNAGEYRVVRSIMRGKSRDFWALAEGKMLPKETLNYVPKFLAMLIIGKNLEKYNIQFKESEKWDINYKQVEVPSSFKLTSLARITNVPLKILRHWNQDLLRGRTPYSRNGVVEIYLPEAEALKVMSHRQQLAKYIKKKPYQRRRRSNKSMYSIYVVKSGDTLSGISGRLGISLRTLMKINRLRIKRKIHPGQRLRYYLTNSRSISSNEIYLVKRNDTLEHIARKNKSTVRSLQILNNIRGSKIYAGQILRLPASAIRGGYHLVLNGENLFIIARRYNATIAKLKKINNLTNDRIYPGQKILIQKK